MSPASARTLRGDIFGGLTAAVVALPLALAFGVASGAGAIAGLWGAIASGFFAAVLGGTRAQVSGPTGPMTVVMGAVVAQYAQNLAEAFTIVMLGGLFQIAFGLARLGRFVSYTPYSVVSGFMSGIGVIIILIQALPFFGLPAAEGGPIGAVLAWPAIPDAVNAEALAIGIACLFIMIAWPRRAAHILPAPLAALVVGTLMGIVALGGAPVIGEVPGGLPELVVPTLVLDELPQILQAALVLALLGSIDSLLTSLVADSITRTRHDSDRELIGQGIGNLAAGLVGGLPGAGATMRTVVNVRAGGTTPLSGALHAVVLLGFALGLGPLAERVPHAALAGILLKVGWDIIDWGYLRRLRHAPRDKVSVMLITMGLTVAVDLITAVAVGLIVAGFATARWMEVEEMKGVEAIALPAPGTGPLHPETASALADSAGRIQLIRMRGRFSYASARQLTRALGRTVTETRAVVFDFTEAAHIDTSAAMALEELVRSAQDAGAVCHVAALSGVARKTLAGLGVLDLVGHGRVHPDREAAVAAALAEIGGKAEAA
ncbi:SulP family inorganic anion transporter [Limibaculum sp. FT325]|uniref:SulP family inorganic anion transporter n=1 Tax=Thermohalobaculum sediminis TaxID=2939436 RepID=UPI0020BF1A2C|nr:SulP family inorganic anion transporter [Limibaculum sediminis]MCL5778005.1 SulP family inorganic anion transporter [Limibaculum sediminis]